MMTVNDDEKWWWWHWQPREHICPGWPMDKLPKDDHLVSLVTIGDLIFIDKDNDYHSVMMIQLVMMRNQIRWVAKYKWWCWGTSLVVWQNTKTRPIEKSNVAITWNMIVWTWSWSWWSQWLIFHKKNRCENNKLVTESLLWFADIVLWANVALGWPIYHHQSIYDIYKWKSTSGTEWSTFINEYQCIW